MLVVLQLRVLKGGFHPDHLIFKRRLEHSRTLCADSEFVHVALSTFGNCAAYVLVL